MLRENIAAYIAKNGIKQSYLAEKTGMTPIAISSIVNLKRDISAEEYVSVCDALNVTLDFFLHYADTANASTDNCAKGMMKGVR